MGSRKQKNLHFFAGNEFSPVKPCTVSDTNWQERQFEKLSLEMLRIVFHLF